MKKYSEYVNTDELKKIRTQKKKTYEDMSEMLGLKSPVSYYYIETGYVEPKISQMVKIASYLGKPVKNFFNLKLQKN